MSSTTPGYKEVYDISVLLVAEPVDYPGITPYSRDSLFSIASGRNSNVSNLVLSTHSGTHVDIPFHFIPKTKSIDEYPIQRFILPTQVANIQDRESIKPSELEKIDINGGVAILLKTDNSGSG
jgi:arylformamidase